MRLLILGTGGMANQHAKHFATIKGVTLVGGVDVDPKRLEAFNTTHSIPNGFPSLDAALAWGEFDAWIAANGHTPGPDLWECYVVGPEASPDPANWRTQLNRPLSA